MVNNKIHDYLVILAFFLTLSYLVFDIIYDTFTSYKDPYYYMEIVSVILIVFLSINQMKIIKEKSKELDKTKDILWAIKGKMSEYIDSQFIKWNFTKSEIEIAWLIIKGFSPKEVSTTRNVKEKTIHNQLSSIYKKSNTKNKHELLSYFLEDFLNFS